MALLKQSCEFVKMQHRLYKEAVIERCGKINWTQQQTRSPHKVSIVTYFSKRIFKLYLLLESRTAAKKTSHIILWVRERVKNDNQIK